MTDVSVLKQKIASSGGPALGCQYIFNIVPPPMMFNLDNVVRKIKSTDPSVELPSQETFKSHMFSKLEHISMMAESISIPGRQLMTTEHRIFGTVRKMPYGVLYEDMTVTFICTNSMIERTFFDLWHQLIISPGSQYMEFYESYVGTLVVQKISNAVATKGAQKGQLSKKQNLATYVLMEAYPVSIQAQELNYSDGEYLKLTVQFAYAKWKSILDLAFAQDSNLRIDGVE